LTVANTADSGAGSLRDALASAAPGDTIAFSAGVSGTIALSSTLAVAQNVTIDGPGAATLTLDGQNTVSIMSVAAANTVTVSGLTFANGMGTAGGAIQNAGTLSVAASLFTANKANNGGAIQNVANATISINDCTFQNNTTTSVGGGALLNIGVATVTNSTLTGNVAAVNGGAFNNQPGGTLTVINDTFFGNQSNGLGGAISNLETVSIFDSTFAGNHGAGGSAIATGTSTVTLDNSVFADNVSSATPGAISGAGFTEASNNVFYNNTANGTADDQTGYATTAFVVAAAEPLKPLADYGGPTQTMAPVAGGAASCAGSLALLPGGVTTDQRGLPRVSGSCLDAGSVQVSQAAVVRVAVPALSVWALTLLATFIGGLSAASVRRRSRAVHR